MSKRRTRPRTKVRPTSGARIEPCHIRPLPHRTRPHAPLADHHSEGRVEWPPSQWRLLRALAAVAGRGLTSLPCPDDFPPPPKLDVTVPGAISGASFFWDFGWELALARPTHKSSNGLHFNLDLAGTNSAGNNVSILSSERDGQNR